MQKFWHLAFAGFYLFMMNVTVSGCSQEKNELAHDHSHEHNHNTTNHVHNHDGEHSHKDHEGHDHGNGNEIILEPEQASRMGVVTSEVHTGPFADALRVSARINPSPSSTASASASTSGIFVFSKGINVGSHVKRGQTLGHIDTRTVSGGDSNAAALAELNSAKRELDRLTPLYEKRLITADKYNAAVTAYELAKARYSPAASSGAVTAPISGIITALTVTEGQYVDVGNVIADITDGETLSLTADVPQRHARLIPTFNSARIVTDNGQTITDLATLGARKVSSATPISTKPGYVPVSFTFNNDGSLIAGSVVEAYLIGAERSNVISIPLTAITEQQGKHFVFVKVDEEGYIKSPVTLGVRNGSTVEIKKGLHEGDVIVTEGVSALRLAETSGAVPEGHTHSH
ncbi:MAG: efflux RND transporter periplasmic adaptor subunit [Muribaculaceae bacterium]|nr:efflux RND transporter periplasmic adaptor subunit [Muribaculaceae bacterium]